MEYIVKRTCRGLRPRQLFDLCEFDLGRGIFSDEWPQPTPPQNQGVPILVCHHLTPPPPPLEKIYPLSRELVTIVFFTINNPFPGLKTYAPKVPLFPEKMGTHMWSLMHSSWGGGGGEGLGWWPTYNIHEPDRDADSWKAVAKACDERTEELKLVDGFFVCYEVHLACLQRGNSGRGIVKRIKKTKLIVNNSKSYAQIYTEIAE